MKYLKLLLGYILDLFIMFLAQLGNNYFAKQGSFLKHPILFVLDTALTAIATVFIVYLAICVLMFIANLLTKNIKIVAPVNISDATGDNSLARIIVVLLVLVLIGIFVIIIWELILRPYKIFIWIGMLAFIVLAIRQLNAFKNSKE